jgi:hypothetical protein
MTADLGEGGGRDSTVILVGDAFGLLYGEESPWVGPAQAAAHMAGLHRTWDVRQDRIVFDAGGGRGLDVRPYLEQHGITDALGYKGAREGGEKFKNKRSAMGWRLRQRLDPERPRELPILRHDQERKPSVFDPPPDPTTHEKQPPFCLPGRQAVVAAALRGAQEPQV